MISAYQLTLWMHVLIMGYWIGSDLVVNALTHYTTHADKLPTAERNRLFKFLLHVDQHPRNAMILSVPLGFTLAKQTGVMALSPAGLAAIWAVSALWFAFMWTVHLNKDKPLGATLQRWDWRSRYLIIAFFIGLGLYGLITGQVIAARWLSLKLILFGLVISCGIGIRYYIREAAEAWPAFLEHGSTPEFEALFRRAMWRGTYVLWCLWALLFAIGYLGAAKPF